MLKNMETENTRKLIQGVLVYRDLDYRDFAIPGLKKRCHLLDYQEFLEIAGYLLVIDILVF